MNARLVVAAAPLLSLATRAAAHGTSEGALLPHAHPHASPGVESLAMALAAVGVVGAVTLIARAIAKRR